MGRYGGKNTQIFFAETNSGATGYDLKKIDGTTAATQASHRVLLLDESVSVKRNITGKVCNIEFDQDKDDADYLAWHEATSGAVSEETSSVQPSKRQYEDGSSKYGDAAVATGQLNAIISYGAKSTDNKRKVWGVLGVADEANGSDTQEAEKTTAPATKINGVKAEYDLDLSALLDSTLVAGSQTLEIPAGRGYVWKFLTAA